MIQPPPLQKGDLVYLTAPAKSIDEKPVLYAKKWLEEKGFRVLISKHCLGQYHYFSGTDAERIADFQFGLDNDDVKAIICVRGGYGCVRIVDNINWAGLLLQPKWIIGFSDITVFHHRLNKIGVKSIHGTMPLNFESNSDEALSTLFKALTNEKFTIEAKNSPFNKSGEAKGQLVGGNLSIVYSLLGTDDAFKFDGTILFLEDLAEQMYHLDRMFFSLKKSGALDKINGLILGGFTELKDTLTPFGQLLEEIVLQHFEYRKIPIAFQFPTGHIDDNRALVLGSKIELSVQKDRTILSYLN